MSKNLGGVWFSSQWNGRSTDLKTVSNLSERPISVGGVNY